MDCRLSHFRNSSDTWRFKPAHKRNNGEFLGIFRGHQERDSAMSIRVFGDIARVIIEPLASSRPTRHIYLYRARFARQLVQVSLCSASASNFLKQGHKHFPKPTVYLGS